jgi:hypothetical protein
MASFSALPFTLRRKSEVFSGLGMTTTTETVHGLLRLDREELTIQWRLARKVEHLGGEIRSDEELEAVREVHVPLRGLVGALVKNRWWAWPLGLRLEITASDLGSFQEVAGQTGLKMAHPAQLVVGIKRRDRLAAQEFAADLTLVVAETALEASVGRRSLPGIDKASEPPFGAIPGQGEGDSNEG